MRLGIITGRSISSLHRLAGELGEIDLATAGGFRITRASGESSTAPGALSRLPAIQNARKELERLCADLPGTLVEDKELSLAVHWRLAPWHEKSLRRAVQSIVAREPGQLRVVAGKCVLELQPDMAWDKGQALREVVGRWGAETPIAFVGDDVIDRPAWQAVESLGGLAIGVGSDDPTLPRRRLPDTDAVRRLLHRLA